MKILVAGAGPAGLYFSYLAKRQHPDWLIRVVEQNPADSTFGFGVVFSDRALEFLRDDDAATWKHAGLARMDEGQTLNYCENVFREALGGHRLVSNKSVWRNFPNLRNARWSSGNVVLIGDALRTAHFSIGSGTRLAMEDAIALAKALRTE